jgi:acetyl-CoA carboxylase carboxyl transferase subunit beta
MAWFRREKKPLEAPAPDERTVRTEGLWLKCDGCRNIIWKKDLEANLNVCPRCDHHYRIGSRQRLELLFDSGNYSEHDADLASTDPLKFVDTKSYEERLRTAQSKTKMKDAIVFGEGTLEGRPVQLGAMEFSFIGGSMGAVVGEKVTRAVERSLEQRQWSARWSSASRW